MKKYFLTAILSLLVATVFTSCGDNDIIEGTEKPSSELKVWVEPYHIKGASLDEVTTYMSGTMMRYHSRQRTRPLIVFSWHIRRVMATRLFSIVSCEATAPCIQSLIRNLSPTAV